MATEAKYLKISDKPVVVDYAYTALKDSNGVDISNSLYDLNQDLSDIITELNATAGQGNAFTAIRAEKDETMNRVVIAISSTPVIDLITSIPETKIASASKWNAKQDALTTAQLNACNSGITTDKVTAYDEYASKITSLESSLGDFQVTDITI